MGVLRGGPSYLSLRLPCITRPTGYVRWSSWLVGPIGLYIYIAHIFLSDIHQSRCLTGSTMPWVFSILINIIFIIIQCVFCSQLNWVIRITLLLVFSVGSHIRIWILFYFIILLFSWLIWDLNMFEGFSPLALD
jgi:hypothetical protein